MKVEAVSRREASTATCLLSPNLSISGLWNPRPLLQRLSSVLWQKVVTAMTRCGDSPIKLHNKARWWLALNTVCGVLGVI